MNVSVAAAGRTSWYNEFVRERPEVYHPHDRGFKSLLSSKKIFLQMLRSFVRQSWVDALSEEHLIRVDKSFVTANFREKESDLVFKAELPLQTESAALFYFVLLELQSAVNHLMPFRILDYQCELLRDAVKNAGIEAHRKSYRLPVVIPIVLYNGKEPWTVPLRYRDKTTRVPDAEGLLDFSYILIDVHRFDKTRLLEQGNLVGGVFALEQANDVNEMLEIMHRMAFVLQELSEEEWETFKGWARWILTREMPKPEREMVDRIIVTSKREEAKRMISNVHEVIRRTFEKEREEGRLEGRLEGKLEGRMEGKLEVAGRLLEMGMSVEQVAQVVQLPEEEVRKLLTH